MLLNQRLNHVSYMVTQNSLSFQTAIKLFIKYAHGRRLRGNWEDGPPQSLRWGRPMHSSPNIWETRYTHAPRYLWLRRYIGYYTLRHLTLWLSPRVPVTAVRLKC